MSSGKEGNGLPRRLGLVSVVSTVCLVWRWTVFDILAISEGLRTSAVVFPFKTAERAFSIDMMLSWRSNRILVVVTVVASPRQGYNFRHYERVAL